MTIYPADLTFFLHLADWRNIFEKNVSAAFHPPSSCLGIIRQDKVFR